MKNYYEAIVLTLRSLRYGTRKKGLFDQVFKFTFSSRRAYTIQRAIPMEEITTKD
jgi:hypothetical protein